MLERNGFITEGEGTPSGFRVRPIAFLAWFAAKLRRASATVESWTQWLRAEGWSAIRVRQADWGTLPLASLHSLPRDGRAITERDADEAWAEIAAELRTVAMSLR